jgi:acylphosphatase
MSAMIEKQAFYAGRVQGVGFRFGTKQIATGYDVIGWVRNLPDGRVELQVKGEAEEVAEFLLEIRENSNLSHHILEYEETDLPTGTLTGVKGFSTVR